MNENLELSYATRKALNVQIGEAAGNEISSLLQRMAAEIEELKRSKVTVTRLVPEKKSESGIPSYQFEDENF